MAMEMEDDFPSGSELSSDEEAGMQETLFELKQNQLRWIERMDVVVPVDSAPVVTAEEEEEGERRGTSTDPEDEFKREMHFYQQAQSSVLAGLCKLEKLGVPTQRPDDFFTELVKTNDHMRKVRQNLLSRQKMLEQVEMARKMRELKKYGKKVQQEILQKRREEKKATLQAVKKYSSKRGRGERPSFLGQETEGELPVAVEGVSAGRQGAGAGRKRAGGKVGEKSVKRMAKDKKFGFRRGKQGAGNSVAQGRRRGKQGKNVRLGKSRRQKNKMKLRRH